ncbi:MAG: dependent oxidoreductase [Acidimicrobiaceae bacterium]|nr:dependent oxidoreductase [Acidimicrobiaceae bacterium]
MTTSSTRLDAAVVGSGPNGLAAAITLARAGLSVEVFEGASSAGGGCRTEELTLPGFHHDVCSTIQSMIALSPFFKTFELTSRGVPLCTPEIAFAHPLDGGRAAALVGSVATTAEGLGRDGHAYEKLMGPLVDQSAKTAPSILAPILTVPSHPFAMARFGRAGLRSASQLVKRFSTDEAKALMAGVSAHAMLPLDAPMTSAVGLFLAMSAHIGGWPVVEGGSAVLVEALLGALKDSGGTVHVDRYIASASDLPHARLTLFDTSPQTMVEVMGERVTSRYRRDVARFRSGPGVCKVDWALSGSVPWLAPECRRAATVHVGGTFEEVAAAENDVAWGRHAERPYCIVVQPSLVDSTRAPSGKSTLWAYCHVPNGSDVDMTSRIEDQIERFAPGFRDLILARSTMTATDEQRYNANYVGGDINGGAGTLRQTLFRPALRWNPYRTGTPGLYLCSASTPPGGGVHGMCGVGAARAALRDLRRTP